MPGVSAICQPPGNVADLVFVADSSGSMSADAGAGYDGNRLDLIKDGLGQILGRLDSFDRSGLVEYDSGVQATSPLTTLHSDTAASVNAMVVGGGTDAEPAIDQAQAELTAAGAGPLKIIVHLSDGDSGGDPVRAAEDAKAAGTEFFSLAIGDGLTEFGLDSLEEQASDPKSTHFFNVRTPEEFDVAIDSIGTSAVGALELQSQSFAIMGRGLLALLGDNPLNPVEFRRGDANPEDDTAGGNTSIVPLPLEYQGTGIDAGVISNTATGGYEEGDPVAYAMAVNEIPRVALLGADFPALAIEAVRATATANIETVTDLPNAYTTEASTEIARLTLGGIPIPLELFPANTMIPLSPLLTLVINEQIEISTAYRAGVMVNAVHLYLIDEGEEYAGDLVVGHSFAGATCGGPNGIGEVSIPRHPAEGIFGDIGFPPEFPTEPPDGFTFICDIPVFGPAFMEAIGQSCD